MRSVSKLLVSVVVVAVGLVLLLVEALRVIVGNVTLSTLGEVLLWLGFALIALGAVGMVWSIATADVPEPASDG